LTEPSARMLGRDKRAFFCALASKPGPVTNASVSRMWTECSGRYRWIISRHRGQDRTRGSAHLHKPGRPATYRPSKAHTVSRSVRRPNLAILSALLENSKSASVVGPGGFTPGLELRYQQSPGRSVGKGAPSIERRSLPTGVWGVTPTKRHLASKGPRKRKTSNESPNAPAVDPQGSAFSLSGVGSTRKKQVPDSSPARDEEDFRFRTLQRPGMCASAGGVGWTGIRVWSVQKGAWLQCGDLGGVSGPLVFGHRPSLVRRG